MNFETDINVYDNEIQRFIDTLKEMTLKSRLLWKPLAKYMNEMEINDSDLEYANSCYSELKQIMYGKNTINYFEEDSFFLEKKGSLIFLIHVQQRSQLDETISDNYILYGSPCKGGYLMHMCGLSKQSQMEKENAQKLCNLSNIVKTDYSKWLYTDGGGDGPMSNIIRNILSD